MNRQQPKILCDSDLDSGECALAQQVITDACTWLLNQPRHMGIDSCHPMFSELTFHVGRNRPNKGLRHRINGVGRQQLAFTNLFAVMSEPKQNIETTHTIAMGAACAFMLNQLFQCESWGTENFDREPHYQMQLRWLAEFAPDVLVKFKAESSDRKQKKQLKQKHALQLARQHKNRQPQQPKRSAPHYSAPPAPLPPQPPAAPIQHPKPVLSEQDKRALEVLENQQLYMASFCTTDCTTEDHDK